MKETICSCGSKTRIVVYRRRRWVLMGKRNVAIEVGEPEYRCAVCENQEEKRDGR